MKHDPHVCDAPGRGGLVMGMCARFAGLQMRISADALSLLQIRPYCQGKAEQPYCCRLVPQLGLFSDSKKK
jgi:hypothetical protein